MPSPDNYERTRSLKGWARSAVLVAIEQQRQSSLTVASVWSNRHTRVTDLAFVCQMTVRFLKWLCSITGTVDASALWAYLNSLG